MKTLLLIPLLFLFPSLISAQERPTLCIVNDAKFEPFTLHNTPTGNTKNIWKKDSEGQNPLVQLVVNTTGCKGRTIPGAIFSIGYNAEGDQGLFRKHINTVALLIRL